MNFKDIPANSNITASELRAFNAPVLDGKAEDLSKYTFWQYTSVNSIELILKGNCFWIGNIANMNDEREAELHSTEKENIFVQCFCNSNSEKIPMWYLYGGIIGRGASIGFTPGVMINYIKSIKTVTELVRDGDNKLVEGEKYEIGKDFDLKTGWVYYADDKNADNASAAHSSKAKNRIIRVNYWNKFVNVVDARNFYKSNYFIKDYPWEYEKEFRLVFINKTGKKIEKIKVDIPEEFRTRKDRKIKICLAPEISAKRNDKSTKDEYDQVETSIRKTGESYQLVINPSNLKINMNLLDRNKNDIIDYVKKHPEFLKGV